MKIRVYCNETDGDEYASKIVRRDVEFDIGTAKALNGYSPVKPNIKDRDGFMGLWSMSTKVTEDLFVDIVTMYWAKDAEIRKSLVSYIGEEFDPNISNDMSLDAAFGIMRRYAEESNVGVHRYVEESNAGVQSTYHTLLDIMGFITNAAFVQIKLPTGYTVLCHSAYGVTMSSFGIEAKLQMVYSKDNDPIFIYENGQITIDELPFEIAVCTANTENTMVIDNQPIFDIFGKIKLEYLKQPARVTKNWLTEVAHAININISGLEQSESLDKIYERLNTIAHNTRIVIKAPYFLLSEDFIKSAPVDYSEDKINGDKNKMISMMARRQGLVVLPGNANFNEGTLKDGATWYIAKLKQEKE